MPTFWAVALVFALFSVYIERADFQKTKAGDAAKDLVVAASTTKNETKKEDKLTKILPLVTFDCTGRTEGYYADVQFDCEAFHYCKASGERFTFVCPPKSRFNQKHMICDYDRYGLKLCYTAEKYFKLNENLYPKTEDEKAESDASTTTVKSQEKKKTVVVKNEASARQEAKPVKTQSNKAKKLEKTYIVTEYYDHDLPTTEQPIIDDASPKVYKWYTPPVTSDSPLDDVEYDDSIRHQYEYPDDYQDDPYYGHREDNAHNDHSKEKTAVAYSHGKDKKAYTYNEHDQKKFGKDKAKTQTSSSDKSRHKNKEHYEEPDTKQTQSGKKGYRNSHNDRLYENSNTKDISHSDLKPRFEVKEVPEDQTVKESYQEVSRPNKEDDKNDDRYNERVYSTPVKDEDQKYGKDERTDDVENPASAEQSGDYHNYQQQPQTEPEVNYYQNNKEDQDENYGVEKAEHQELRDARNEEAKVYEPSGKRVIEIPQSGYHETVNPQNYHNREESRYRTPISKPNQYKIIFKNPEGNTKIHTQRIIPEARNSKTSLPQGKSKTTSFYHRYTSKMEQPTRTTIYRGGKPEDDQISRTPYNERQSELKDLQNNDEEVNLQRENSREVIDEQKLRQLSYPENQQEEASQEEGVDNGQEVSYEEETEEVNNQPTPPRQHYREQQREINPQRNPGIYIQQELPQQRQIPVEIHPQIFYQRDRNGNLQPYQKDILQRENSGEVVTHEHLTQYRPESSTEDRYNQDKTTHYRAEQPQNLPQREYNTPNYQYAAHNLGGHIHTASPRPHTTQNSQYSAQRYSANQYKNNRPAIYQPNINVRETQRIQQEINMQQQSRQPRYQQNHNIHGSSKYIPNHRLIHNEKNHQNVNIYKPDNEYANIQQQQRQANYRYVAPERLQPTHQPQLQTVQNYDRRQPQPYASQNTQFNHHRTSEQPQIRFVTRRQKRQTSSGLPLSSQFRTLLNRLYTPVGSPSNNHLNNFQNFISSSIPSAQPSETSRNPTQHRPTSYFPQQYHYNPRFQSPYNSAAQNLYDRSPVYSDPQFQQAPYYYQPPNRPPLTSYPNNNFRYYDDNGEHLNQNIRNIPLRPAEGIPSPKPATNDEQDESSNKPTESVEQAEEPHQSDNSQNKRPTYPPLPTINPQNFPELKDFPFFNPSYSYSQTGNRSLTDTENSQYSYNRIPPSRYHVPDLGVYFDPYGEFGVTPLYEPSQTTSDDTKDPDSTESPANKEQPEENEGKKEDISRRRVPGRIKRPLNAISNPPYDEKHNSDKPRGDLFITAPPRHPVSTYNPRSVNLFVTPPSYLIGHSRAPSVFGPEFFVPPLRPPLTTESSSKETSEKHVTDLDDSSPTSTEVTTPTPTTQATTPVQRQRGHRRRPQSTTRPNQGIRVTTRQPSASRSSSRHISTSQRDSSRHSSESIRPHSEQPQPSRPTTRRPTRPPSRAPVRERERPKPATLPPVRPTQQSTPESDSSEDGEPNPFRGSVPYGTRLRRPSPSRQTSSKLSHVSASTLKRVEQSSASDRSFTIARKEPRQRPYRIQSVERSHQPRRATTQFRETTPNPTSSTTYQTPPWTESRSRNIFRYSSNEEGTTTTVGYSPNDNDDEDEQRVRRPSVRRATYIRRNQDAKPEIKPKLFRGRTRARNYHPRRGYSQATTQSTTTTSEAATTPMPTTSTTKSPPSINHHIAIETTTTSTTTMTPPKLTIETIIVEMEPTPKLRVYTSRHGGSLRNERVINRLKDKPRLFTFGRPRGGTVDDSSFDETNYATESSSES